MTERELAIVRLLPTHLSAVEIGEQLYISVHTVKTHIRHVYEKLDVHRRSDAVVRARSLGLLG
jgi:LuxR family maltose regulon positive regulatory protein